MNKLRKGQADSETTIKDHIIHYDGLEYGFNGENYEKCVDLGRILKGEIELITKMRRLIRRGVKYDS